MTLKITHPETGVPVEVRWQMKRLNFEVDAPLVARLGGFTQDEIAETVRDCRAYSGKCIYEREALERIEEFSGSLVF